MQERRAEGRGEDAGQGRGVAGQEAGRSGQKVMHTRGHDGRGWRMAIVGGSTARRAVAGLLLLLTAAAAWLWAHEGHAPLPTKGVVVDVARGRLTVNKDARDALDVRSAAVVSQALPEKLLAYATVL